MVSNSEYDELEAFREDLDYFIRYRLGLMKPDDTQSDAVARIRTLQPQLNRKYGALEPLIRRYSGIPQLRDPIHGITSDDVIRDAINSPDHPDYQTIAESAVPHLDIALGRVKRDIGQPFFPTEDVTNPTVQASRPSGGPLRRSMNLLLSLKVLVVAALSVIVTALVLFFAVFGADWDQVGRNIQAIRRFFFGP